MPYAMDATDATDATVTSGTGSLRIQIRIREDDIVLPSVLTEHWYPACCLVPVRLFHHAAAKKPKMLHVVLQGFMHKRSFVVEKSVMDKSVLLCWQSIFGSNQQKKISTQKLECL